MYLIKFNPTIILLLTILNNYDAHIHFLISLFLHSSSISSWSLAFLTQPYAQYASELPYDQISVALFIYICYGHIYNNAL